MKLDKKTLDLLEQYSGEVKTAKFFKDNGLTQYNLKRFTELGYLERVSHGNYKIQVVQKKELDNDKHILLQIKDLYASVNAGDYSNVYIITMHICEDKVDNKFDKVLSLVFDLLSNILGKNYDYSFKEKLVFDKTDFTEYESLIYEKKYFEAKKYLDSIVSMMEKNNIVIKDDIKMFQKLVDEVVSKTKSGENTELRKELFTKYYRDFIESLRSKNHNAALNNLDKAISYCDNKAKLKKLLVMREINVATLEVLRYRKSGNKRTDDYKDLEDIEATLSKAIFAHDFMYALYLMDTYSFSTSKIYKTIKYMLLSMFRLAGEMDIYDKFRDELDNKKYTSGEEKDEIEEVIKNDQEKIPVSEVVTPQADLSLNGEKYEQEEKEARKSDEIIKPLEEVKQSYDFEYVLPQTNNYERERKYRVFLVYFNDEDYETAYNYLGEIVQGDSESNEYKLYELLGAYLNMRDKKEGFESLEIEYDETSTRALFDEALRLHDYRTAFRNIGKLTYNNDDEYLGILKVILHNMYELDKKYGKKESTNKKKVTLEEKIVEEKNPVNNTEFVSYSYEELLSLARENDYETIYNNLKKGFYKHSLNRVELNTYRLLEIYMSLRCNNLKVYEDERIEFDGNYFRCFFDAIRYHQIDEIEYYFNMCYEKALDKSELEIYGCLVDSIVKMNEEIERKREIEEKEQEEKIRILKCIKDVNSKMKELLNNRVDLNEEELDELFNLLDEKSDYDSEATYVESCILDMIEYLIYNPNIDSRYFADLNDYKKNDDYFSYEIDEMSKLSVDEKIDKLLLSGDFIRAYNLIYETPFNKCLLKYSYDNRIIIRGLLNIFTSVLNKPIDYERPVDYRSEELKAIQSRIKRNDFLGAFENILASTHLDHDTLVFVSTNVLVSYIGNSLIEREYAEEFVDALNKNDLNKARIALINYKEVLDRSSYGKVEEYNNKYKDMSKVYEKEKLRVKK